MVGVMKTMATSFKRICARTVVFSALTLQRATVDPHLRQRLLDTHRQVWLSLLWRHLNIVDGRLGAGGSVGGPEDSKVLAP